MLRITLRWIRSFLLSIPFILVFTATLGAIGFLGSLADRRSRILQDCQRLWARLVLAVSFVQVSATGLDKMDPSQAYVFCSNHLSYLDPPVILASLNRSACFLAKQSLFSIPFLGWAMRRAGDVPLDRQDPHQATRSLAMAAQRIRQGVSLITFPEGTRSLDGKLQPFLSGAFRLAIKTQAPVVPVAIFGTREALSPGSLQFRGGHVQLRVGDPISTQGMTKQDKNKLADQTWQRIEEMLREASSSKPC